ncbi:hypothetical protein AB6O49_23695 [Streptomyces sp. SBR177]
MMIESESARLLLWVMAETGGDTMHIVSVDANVDPAWQHLDEAAVIVLIEHLEHRRLVTTYRTFASGVACRITSAGVAEASRLARRRDHPRYRFDFAADSLVAAAMEDYPRARVSLATFVGTRHMWLYDYVLEIDEVLRAVAYLEENQIAAVERGPSQAQAITLTPSASSADVKNQYL